MQEKFNLYLKIDDLKITNNFKNTLIENEIYTSIPSMQISYNYISNSFDRDKLIIEVSNFENNIHKFQGKKASIFYYDFSKKQKFQEQRMIISKITKSENGFLLELIGISELFNVQKMNYFSEKCRAELGDSLCKIDIQKISLYGIITGFSKDYIEIYDKSLQVQNPKSFNHGKFKIETIDEEFLIRKLENGLITLLFEPFVQLKIGMKFQIYPSCDKTLKTCKMEYNNVVNFRGEPFVFEKHSSSSF